MQLPAEQHSRLSQIAMAVKPKGMIADLVMPRVDVGAKQFKYTQLETSDMFTIPDTKMGRKSEFNEVEFGSELKDGSVKDWGLADIVPDDDIKVAESGAINFKPFDVAVEGTSLLVDLAREQRVAQAIFNSNNYATNLRTTLSGADQWDDPASDPYNQIMDYIENMLVRPNAATLGRKAYRYLRQHPKIVAGVLNNGGQVAGGEGATGYVSRQALADYLELDEIHVGEAFYNSAKKGQAMQTARLWGNHAAFTRIDRSIAAPDRISMPVYGITAEFGNKQTRTVDLPDRGVKGSTKVIVAEQLDELIVYKEGGFFIQNVVN